MIEIEVVTETREFEGLRAQWTQLLNECPANTIFLTWEWAFSWWQVYGNGRQLFLLVAKSDQRVVGIAPLVISRTLQYGFLPMRQIEWIGARFVSGEYLDFILTPGMETDTLNAMMDFLVRERWDEMPLTDMSEHSSTMKLISEMASRLRIQCEVASRNICPYVSLPKTCEAFEQQIKPRVLKNLKYQKRRLTRDFEMKTEYVQDVGGLDEALESLWTLHQQRWAEKGESGNFRPGTKRRFYAEVARRCLKKGWLRLYRLRIDGKVVAVLFGFRYADHFYYLQGGFDPEWTKYSVGQVLLGEIFGDCIRDGASGFDFLRGPEAYKYDWGAWDKRTCQVTIRKKCIKSLAISRIANSHQFLKRVGGQASKLRAKQSHK